MPRAKKDAVETKTATAAKTETAEKKTPAKKTTRKPAAKVELFVEFNGCKASTDEIIKNVKATYAAKGEKADIKSLKIYVKPDDNAAYYVVNDDFSDKMDVFFCE